MALGNVNIVVNTSVMTVGRVRVQLPNALTGAQTPITLKNISGDIPTVEQLRNVNVISANGGEILVYNANTNNYDIRDLTLGDVDLSNANLDAGWF
jgi:hypothetical protein